MKELIILVLIALPFVIVSAISIKKIFQIESVSEAVRILTVQELELVKKYSALFGIDNEAHNVDVEQILEMGRKYEDYLGTETMDSLFEQHQSHHCNTMQENIALYMNVRRCHVNRVMREHSMSVAIGFTTVFTKTISGGTKDGEPTISLH